MAEKTNRKPKNDLVEDFDTDYAEALVETRKAAETTATDGWQALYTHAIGENLKARSELADALELDARGMRADSVPGEDARKEAKEHMKSLIEWCEQADSFDEMTVKPIRGTVERLGEVMREYEGKAQSAERDASLTAAGIVDRMTDAIARQPKATWNPRVGLVAVIEPK
jgi:hypothetical protein